MWVVKYLEDLQKKVIYFCAIDTYNTDKTKKILRIDKVSNKITNKELEKKNNKKVSVLLPFFFTYVFCKVKALHNPMTN